MPENDPTVDTSFIGTASTMQLVKAIIEQKLRAPESDCSTLEQSYRDSEFPVDTLRDTYETVNDIFRDLRKKGFEDKHLTEEVMDPLVKYCTTIIIEKHVMKGGEKFLSAREKHIEKIIKLVKPSGRLATSSTEDFPTHRFTYEEASPQFSTDAEVIPENATQDVPITEEVRPSSYDETKVREQLEKGFVYRALYHIVGDKPVLIFCSPSPSDVAQEYHRYHFAHTLYRAIRSSPLLHTGHQGLWFMELTTDSPHKLTRLFNEACRLKLKRRDENKEERAEEDKADLQVEIDQSTREFFVKSLHKSLTGRDRLHSRITQIRRAKVTGRPLDTYSMSTELGVRHFFQDAKRGEFHLESSKLCLNCFGLPSPTAENDHREAVAVWLNRGRHSCNNRCHVQYIDFVAQLLKKEGVLTPSQVISSLENFDDAELVAIAQSLGRYARECGKEDLFDELVVPSSDAASTESSEQPEESSSEETAEDKKVNEEAIRLGKRLRDARTSLGWTQGELAEHLNYGSIDQGYISNYERGQKYPTSEPLKRIEAFILEAKVMLASKRN